MITRNGHHESAREFRSVVALLKVCSKKKDLCGGSQVHSDIVTEGLLKDNIYVSNALINVYVKCAAFAKARQLFEDLPVRDVVSWNTLIGGYSQHGHGEETLRYFEHMQTEGVSPDAVTFNCILKVCGCIVATDKGEEIHLEIVKQGLLADNIVLGNSLVNMYAKCGKYAKAWKLLDQLTIRDVVSWTTLIAAYTQHGRFQDAVDCFELMERDGIVPNNVTFACILQVFGSIGAAGKGEELHAKIAQEGLIGKDMLLSTALVDMYATCGALIKARQVFDELPVRDVVTWNILISGYIHHGCDDTVLDCFERMQRDGFAPNTITFGCVLRACGSTGAAKKGEQIHAEIIRRKFLGNHVTLGDALVDMYARCGVFSKAQEVFDELPFRDVAAWTALIAGYIQHGQAEEALKCFEEMHRKGVSPNEVTYACILKVCGTLREVKMGEELHAQVVGQSLLHKDAVLGTALLDMYAACGMLRKVQQVFDELPVRDLVSWTALVTIHTEHGHAEEALDCFGQMQSEGISPNTVTFACILKACGNIGALERGEEIHAEIVKEDLLRKGVVLGNALVDMYAKCSALLKAHKVFNELLARDVVTWNAIISGYTQHGQGERALYYFAKMQSEGLSPNSVTFSCILKACGSVGEVERGRQIHAAIMKEGLLAEDVILGNALVDMYAKCGILVKAKDVFHKLPARDVVSWTALISGYTQHGLGYEALDYFDRMQSNGITPDQITLNCLLKACGSIGNIEKGEEIHAKIVKEGWLSKELTLGNTLVYMYAACGAIAKAQEVFEKLPVLDVISWTMLIAGYTQHGLCEEALQCYEQMQIKGLSPDIVTYTCIVDLLGRAGHFDKVTAVLKTMPSTCDLSMWFGLLSACQTWGNVKLGEFAFEQSIQLDEKSAIAYVCMGNIYAAAGMQEQVDKVKALRFQREAWKKPASCWWTDLSGNIHLFSIGDESHPHSEEIHVKIEDITHKLSQEGYFPSLHLGWEDTSQC